MDCLTIPEKADWLKRMLRSISLLTSKQKSVRVKWSHENLSRNWKKVWISNESILRFTIKDTQFSRIHAIKLHPNIFLS